MVVFNKSIHVSLIGLMMMCAPELYAMSARTSRIMSRGAVGIGALVAVRGHLADIRYDQYEPWTGQRDLRQRLNNAAARGNCIHIWWLLVGRGVPINEQVSGATSRSGYWQTPLIEAVKNGNMVTVTFLVKMGAQINGSDSFGNKPLSYARSAEMALLLVKSGADVNGENSDGTTVLMRAAAEGLDQVVGVLVDKGSDVNKPKCRKSMFANTVAEESLHVKGDESKRVGQSALMLAARAGSPAAVKVLLEGGADAYAQDEAGCTAITYAMLGLNDVADEEQVREGYATIVTELLNNSEPDAK